MSAIVIDANVGISFIMPLPYSQKALDQFNQWQAERSKIIVPSLWRYEVLSALRKAIAMGFLTHDNAIAALKELSAMDYQEIPLSSLSDETILIWAERIGQIVTYDAVYLALSEKIGAEFWTADKRLAEAAQGTGANWVHLL